MQPNTITPGRSLTRPKIEELGRWYLEAEDIANTPKGQAMAKEQAARIQREFQRLVKRVSVEFTERDPYPNVEAMRQDIESNKRMFVYTLFSETPLWTEKVNWMARAVHDWDHYVSGADFTMQGEIDAYRYTAARSPALAELYLSEIALQAAANNIIGQFPSGAQKLVAASERILAVGSMLKNPALSTDVPLASMLLASMDEREAMVHLAAKGVSLEDGTLVMTAARILEQMEHPMTQQMAANAHWSSSYVNSLPNSAFLLVKGNERKFPYRNKAGRVDKNHLANALARLAQENTDVTQAERKRLTDKGHAIYEHEFGYAANASAGAPGKRRRSGSGGPPWEHEGKPERWWIWEWTNGDWHTTPAPTRELALQEARAYGAANGATVVESTMRETTPDEIGDLAEGITVWTSGYATNGDNMESNPIDPTAARVWQREAASRDERLAQEAHHQRYHGPGDYRVYLALKKPGKAARDRVQGMLVFDGFRDVIAVEKYGTSEIAATIYAPSDGAAEARVERALGGLHSMYDMVDVPEEDGLLIERLSEQYQYNGDNMESNATTPRLDADDWRKAAGLRSPSSTRGAVPLTEEQYEGAHSAGYEAASYLNSKGMHVGVDDAFVWASEHDRRVPRGISEDDPSFWEWVQGVADGAEAFKAAGSARLQEEVDTGAISPLAAKVAEWLSVSRSDANEIARLMAHAQRPDDSHEDTWATAMNSLQNHIYSGKPRLLWEVLAGSSPRPPSRRVEAWQVGAPDGLRPLAAVLYGPNGQDIIFNLVDNRWELARLGDWAEWFEGTGGEVKWQGNA